MVCLNEHTRPPSAKKLRHTCRAGFSPPGGEELRKQANWFSTQIQPYETEVRGYLRNRFPSVDVDDVVQESYLKLWRWRGRAGGISASRAYFFSTARNTALTLIRRRKFFSDTPVSELPGWTVIDHERDEFESIHKNQQLELVMEVIDQLPARCREIVKLIAWQGLSYQEVAVRLNISESTIRVQTARSIRKIVACLRVRRGRD